jgi:hypothetical protein
MKYLVCAFRNNVMLKSERVNSEQIMFFKDNICSQFNVTEESLTLVKYNLEKVQSFEQCEGYAVKVGVDKISLVQFVESEVDTAVAVDMMTAPMSELQEYYSEEEIQKILDNRDVWTMNDEAELPNQVRRAIKYGKQTVKEEIVIATLQPEV